MRESREQDDPIQTTPETSSISRRALLAGTAALAAAGLSSASQAAPHSDSHAHGAGHDANDLVRTAGDCIVTGELCQAHCQVTLAQGDTRLADCSKSVYEMMAGCTALMQLAAVQSESLPAMTRVCIGLLKDCKAACEKHAKHAVCRACADACEACLEECRKVAG